MAKRAKYRIPLTGTIIKSTPDKALLPLRFISPKTFNNKGVFEEAFVVKEVGKFGPKVIGYKNLDRLKEIIHSYGCVELKEDHLKDLPKMLPPEIITVETSKDSMTVLRSIRSGETFKAIKQQKGLVPYADLQDLYIRIHQAMICPHLFSDKFMAKNMLEAVYSILEDVEGKTIIFTTLIDAVEEISNFLTSKGIKNVACSGRYREKIILSRAEEFVLNPDCNVMVATVQLMGTGFDNLKIAKNCIIYDFNLIAGDLTQAIGRIYRNGQKNQISVFELVQDNPLSQYQFEKIRLQQDIINQTENTKVKAKDSFDLTGLISLALESNLFGSK
jgi:superfamily II DNA/RNA helicase